MKIKITIAIPAYNAEKTIRETLASALLQEYPLKEILVIDDCSKDRTTDIVETYAKVNPEIRLIKNEVNLGIGKNLEKLMNEAKGKYIVFLCADDIFTTPKLVSDIVNQFDNGDQDIHIIGRYYYYFLDGHPGAIGTCRDMNILTQACCPSGMAFRRSIDVVGSNKIFVEMPSIVAQYLKKYRWTMFVYDTVGARFHPGGNTGTKKEYYTESPWQNWVDLTGDKYFKDFQSFPMLKNRAPHLLWREICLAVKLNPMVLFDPDFWFYASIAVFVPGFILRPLTVLYRDKVIRHSVGIIERKE